MIPTDKPCKYCGLPIENVSKSQKYHPECRKAVQKQYHKDYNHERIAIRKALRPEKFCLTCGVLIPPPDGRGRPRDYCPECYKVRASERLAELSKQQHRDCKNARRKKRTVKCKTRKKPVPHCWDLDCKSTMQLDVESRALGLSIGKYEALCNSLFIERYLNSEGIYNGLDRAETAWKDFKREQKRREEVNRIARANSVLKMEVK